MGFNLQKEKSKRKGALGLRMTRKQKALDKALSSPKQSVLGLSAILGEESKVSDQPYDLALALDKVTDAPTKVTVDGPKEVTVAPKEETVASTEETVAPKEETLAEEKTQDFIDTTDPTSVFVLEDANEKYWVVAKDGRVGDSEREEGAPENSYMVVGFWKEIFDADLDPSTDGDAAQEIAGSTSPVIN